MVLVDSSVWVLVDRGLVDLAAISESDDVVICPPILQEVLQGARANRYLPLRETLLHVEMIDAPMSVARFEEAAQLYRRCRSGAVTIRNSMDCLVAACALAHDLHILHDDSDFEHIARVVPLKQSRLPLP